MKVPTTAYEIAVTFNGIPSKQEIIDKLFAIQSLLVDFGSKEELQKYHKFYDPFNIDDVAQTVLDEVTNIIVELHDVDCG